MHKCPEQFNIDYELPSGNAVSIVIPTKNNSKVLEACIESILRYADVDNYEIIIVDNGSSREHAISNEALASKVAEHTYIYLDIKFNFSTLFLVHELVSYVRYLEWISNTRLHPPSVM